MRHDSGCGLVGCDAPTERVFTDEQIAEVVYTANEAIRRFNGQESRGLWADAPVEVREGLISAVGKMSSWQRLQTGFLDCRDVHNAWSYAKLSAGWKYGPVEDAEAKTHPNMVPYDDLPESEKVKDMLFLGIALGTAQFRIAVPPTPATGGGQDIGR